MSEDLRSPLLVETVIFQRRSPTLLSRALGVSEAAVAEEVDLLVAEGVLRIAAEEGRFLIEPDLAAVREALAAELRGLIDAWQQTQQPDPQQWRRVGPAELVPLTRGLCRGVRRVTVILGGPAPVATAMLRALEAEQHRFRDAAELRLLAPRTELLAHAERLASLVDDRLAVRADDQIGSGFAVFEGSGALAWTDGAVSARAGGAQALEPEELGDLEALAELLYEAGSDPAVVTPEAVAALLAEGLTDTAAARRLGITDRQFRRHVAQLMDELGATSRFQAGVRGQGLLG
ncbi:response regulator transcription factor [Parenemella sanctibonifatiensis]|nr:response regulator transcription factor [Parenemella sanctibonifatiensis]